MTETDRPQTPGRPNGAAPEPSDVPEARPAELQGLDALVGEWEVEVPAPGGVGGRTAFEWLDGGFFLVQRWTIDHAEAVNGIAVIGAEAGGGLKQRYFDSRGVHRVYEMGLDGGVWRLWRSSPGFSQRFTGRFADGGETIEGVWEKSAGGAHWERDFAMVYRKIG
ncbi:MAG: hypothetical protein M0026_06595 [Nocardiopsaceae bacterium]|mgnify:CR=1 FL=1|nr:hypothetical protein [Nocardiopsaceae bacterium]